MYWQLNPGSVLSVLYISSHYPLHVYYGFPIFPAQVAPWKSASAIILPPEHYTSFLTDCFIYIFV